jgi:multiple sugar transport system permease protein
MTEGGPLSSSTVVVEQIVENTFDYGRAGYASAQSIVLFVIILFVTAAQLWLQRRWVFYAQ